MSGNRPGLEGVDQRVARTRGRLSHALIHLGQRQDIDSIRVGDLVKIAGVARSTFYAHFTDRDDFLGRSFCGMIDICDALARREGLAADILPVAHISHHIAGNLVFARGAGRSRAMEIMLAAGERRLRLIAETNLDAALPRVPPEERRQVAAFLAGAFVGQLRLWMQNDLRTAPENLVSANRRLTAGVIDVLAATTPQPLMHTQGRRPAHVP